MLITVDFEKMIEDDHEHCCGAEEEGEGVEGGVGDHFFVVSVCFLDFWEGVGLRGGAEVFGTVVVVDWFGGGLVWLWCVLGFNGER